VILYQGHLLQLGRYGYRYIQIEVFLSFMVLLHHLIKALNLSLTFEVSVYLISFDERSLLRQTL
jgi:hypothetical protein